MKRSSHSFELALSAIACAVAVCALTLGSYVDALLAAGTIVAVFALMVPLAKDMVRGYLFAFFGASALALLFTGFVVGVMRILPFLVFFGLHPLANYVQRRFVRKWWVHGICFIGKAAWFDLSMWLFWIVLTPVLGFQEMTWYPFIEERLYLFLFAGGTLVFVIYDVAIFFCQRSVDAMVRRIRR